MTPAEHADLRPLLKGGYRLISDSVDDSHFGNRIIEFGRNGVILRLVRDRAEWFADVGVEADPGTYFDFSIVIRAVGGQFPLPEATRQSLCGIVSFIGANQALWLPLFEPERYPDSRQLLRSIEVAVAREQFGYVAE